MATVFQNLETVRRVAVGVSATAQGLDGVPELTRTAREALAAAAWLVDDSAPFIPVHEYDRTVPAGDAFKACYGYSASERTERAAAGAVCYTFKIPADALTGETCTVEQIDATVSGDRYLDAGVDVHAVLSASATPPTVAELLARSPDATVCATSDQTAAPNQRAGVTETVAVAPGTAATAYLHVALLLHDYLGARGAWIEGGAMLVGGKAAVTFSRDVEPDTPEEIPLTAGNSKLTGGDEVFRSVAALAPHYRLGYVGYLWDVNGNSATISNCSNPQAEALNVLFAPSVPVATVENAVAGYESTFLINPTNATHGFAKVCYSCTDNIIAPGIAGVVRSGYLASGTFSALKVANAGAPALPVRLVAYAVATPFFAIRPAVSAVCSPAFWEGKAASVESLTIIADAERLLWQSPSPWESTHSTPDTATTTLAVVPLVSLRVEQGESLNQTFAFPSPVAITSTGYPVSVLVMLRPEIGGTSNTASYTIPAATTLTLVK